MKACQQAESASRNSDDGAGRGAERRLIKDINPRFRWIGHAAAEPGHLRGKL